MTIQKKALLNSLKLVMPGIETGNVVLQGADTFIFHDKKIFSFNNLISVIVPLNDLEESIEGAVHADEFFKVISKFNGDEINLNVTENKTWILKCGRAKAEITLIDFDFESRLNGISPKEEWSDIDDSLVNGVGTCKMNNNKSNFAGIYVNENYICSTDGFNLNRYELKYNLPTFWISDNSANELLKIKNFKHIQVNESWVHFKTDDGTIFSIRTLSDNKYPFESVKKLIDSVNLENCVHGTFPQDLFGAIDRAGSFSIDIQGHISVRLNITKDNIEVSAERSTGKYSEIIDWTDKIENDFEPIIVYVDSTAMEFMAKRTLEFYIIKNERGTPRIMFVSSESKHLMSTFDMN